MKTNPILCVLCALAVQLHAQTYIALVSTNNNVNYPVQTNDVINFLTSSASTPTLFGYTTLGNFKLSVNNGTYTGLTNIGIVPNGGFQYDSVQITHQQSAAVVSNYVPADAIVIPASATGSVSIILESSPDLVNWTAASPGTYGPSAATNRFFRVRAQTQ